MIDDADLEVTMNPRKQTTPGATSGLESLDALPTVRAAEFADWAHRDSAPESSSAPPPRSPFSSDQVYRFCRAVANHPMEPSSAYPKLAGVSPKSAKAIRRELTEKGLICEHLMDLGGRGRSAILLEALPAGIAALVQHSVKVK